MAIREYVGARYVMRVAKAGLVHNPSNTYEALELVQDASGTTYLSVQPVPAGIALSNTDYWILTAVTNAQLEQLLTQVNDLTTDVETLQKENIYDFSNKKVIFIGDSYGTGVTSAGTFTPWTERVAEYLNIPSANYYSLCTDGAGFVSGSTIENSFYHHINTASTSITWPVDEVNMVIICGGANDYNFSSSLITNSTYNIPSTIELAHTKFPNATIYVGMISHNFAPAIKSYGFDKQLQTLKYYQQSARYGATYLTGVENALHDITLLASDGNHPLDEGQQTIAQSIVEALKTGSFSPCGITNNITITPNTGITFTTSGMLERLAPTAVEVSLSDCVIMIGSTVDVVNPIKIGSFVPKYFTDDGNNFGFRTCVQTQYTQNDNVTKGSAIIAMINGEGNTIDLYLDYHANMTGLTQVNIKKQNLFNLPLMVC